MTLEELARVELKPCPFCSGSAVAHYIKGERHHKIRVGCSKCWCAISKTLAEEKADIKDVIKKWNTRVEARIRNEKERIRIINLMKHGALQGIDTGRLDGKCEDVIPLEDAIAIVDEVYKEESEDAELYEKSRDIFHR